jgi:hypothetical protein
MKKCRVKFTKPKVTFISLKCFYVQKNVSVIIYALRYYAKFCQKRFLRTKKKKYGSKELVPLEPPKIIQYHTTVYSILYNNEMCLWL